MDKHTKTPWRMDAMDCSILGTCIGGCQMTESEFKIADIRGWGHLQYFGEDEAIAIQEANAEYIVHCVNNFDKLQAELEKAREFIVKLTHGRCRYCKHEEKEYHELPCVDYSEQQGSPDFDFIGIDQALKEQKGENDTTTS